MDFNHYEYIILIKAMESAYDRLLKADERELEKLHSMPAGPAADKQEARWHAAHRKGTEAWNLLNRLQWEKR